MEDWLAPARTSDELESRDKIARVRFTRKCSQRCTFRHKPCLWDALGHYSSMLQGIAAAWVIRDGLDRCLPDVPVSLILALVVVGCMSYHTKGSMLSSCSSDVTYEIRMLRCIAGEPVLLLK